VQNYTYKVTKGDTFFYFKLSHLFCYINTEIAENTFIKIRKILVYICKIIVIRIRKKLRGFGKCVQIDETAFRRGKIITNPVAALDSDKEIMWVIGLVEEGIGKTYAEFIPDRKIKTFKNFICNNVHDLSLIKTDGHPSYIRYIFNNNCIHEVVNHAKGFRNENGNTKITLRGFGSN
jgi:hypothetical protein